MLLQIIKKLYPYLSKIKRQQFSKAFSYFKNNRYRVKIKKSIYGKWIYKKLNGNKKFYIVISKNNKLIRLGHFKTLKEAKLIKEKFIKGDSK